MDTAIAQTIEQKILKWPGVTTEPNRFGGIEFLVDKKEMGHLHGERLADLPFPVEIKKSLVSTSIASSDLSRVRLCKLLDSKF
jgi:hypothetical protein